jgi:5'-methylthioadenosine phosphorylase
MMGVQVAKQRYYCTGGMFDVKEHDVKIAVIGGSGLYHLDHLTLLGEVHPLTVFDACFCLILCQVRFSCHAWKPWGYPSDKIRVCQLGEQKIAFLARHGKGHPHNPSEVPYRANIAALKNLGVEIVLAFSAVNRWREHASHMDVLTDSYRDACSQGWLVARRNSPS